MNKGLLILILVYGLWILINILITVLKIGDAGVNAHLSLIFTGLPSSLLSLLLPHGTLIAAIVAGLLGLAQWALIAILNGRYRNARKA